MSSEVNLGGLYVTDFSEILAPRVFSTASLSLEFESKICTIVDFFLWANFLGSFSLAQKLFHFRLQNGTTCCTFTISHFLRVSPPAAHLKTLKSVREKVSDLRKESHLQSLEEQLCFKKDNLLDYVKIL